MSKQYQKQVEKRAKNLFEEWKSEFIKRVEHDIQVWTTKAYFEKIKKIINSQEKN